MTTLELIEVAEGRWLAVECCLAADLDALPQPDEGGYLSLRATTITRRWIRDKGLALLKWVAGLAVGLGILFAVAVVLLSLGVSEQLAEDPKLSSPFSWPWAVIHSATA